MPKYLNLKSFQIQTVETLGFKNQKPQSCRGKANKKDKIILFEVDSID